MSTNPIIIYRNRTTRVTIKLAYSVGSDVITSQVRAGVHPNAVLIATWEVEVSADGRTIWLTLDDSDANIISQSGGFTDLKRVTGGEPVNILDNPLAVIIKDVVTP